MATCNNCKKCPHAFSSLSEDEYDIYSCYTDNDKWKDWYCNHPKQQLRMILDFVQDDCEPTVTPPTWCPLKSEIKKEPRKIRTYYEIQSNLRKAEGPSSWDSIEIGKIYHLPPVGREQRCDVYILNKTPYQLTYKVIDMENPSSSKVKTLFKSVDHYYKFFVEHKLFDISTVVNIAEINQVNNVLSK